MQEWLDARMAEWQYDRIAEWNGPSQISYYFEGISVERDPHRFGMQLSPGMFSWTLL